MLADTGPHSFGSVVMSETPIESLLRTRVKELGISLPQLVRRAGMSNVSKGLRRLDSLFGADFVSTRGFIKALPLALDIPPEAVTAAIEQTRKQGNDEAERKWRASFKPNAIVLTGERGRPRQIFVAALLNASQHVHLEFPEALPETDYLDHALAFIAEHRGEISKFFHAPEGIAINWSPDSCSLYTLEGKQIGDNARAKVIGRASIRFR